MVPLINCKKAECIIGLRKEGCLTEMLKLLAFHERELRLCTNLGTLHNVYQRLMS